MTAVQGDNIVGQTAAEEALDDLLQVRRHFLHLREEVDEELRHVLLLPGVDRLVDHVADLAEAQRVVRLPLALHQVANIFRSSWRVLRCLPGQSEVVTKSTEC